MADPVQDALMALRDELIATLTEEQALKVSAAFERLKRRINETHAQQPRWTMNPSARVVRLVPPTKET